MDIHAVSGTCLSSPCLTCLLAPCSSLDTRSRHNLLVIIVSLLLITSSALAWRRGVDPNLQFSSASSSSGTLAVFSEGCGIWLRVNPTAASTSQLIHLRHNQYLDAPVFGGWIGARRLGQSAGSSPMAHGTDGTDTHDSELTQSR
jgi:hypothetical protein